MGLGLTLLDRQDTIIAREKSNNHWKEHGTGRYELSVNGYFMWTGESLPPQEGSN